MRKVFVAIVLFLFQAAHAGVIMDDFLINDDQMGGHRQDFPRIAVGESGEFTVTWMDYRKGGWDIYVQRYDSLGAVQDTNLLVNDDEISNIQYFPDVGMSKHGGSVIVWTDFRVRPNGIYGQMYDPEGTLQGVNLSLTPEPGGQVRRSVIGVDSAGNFVVVVWIGDRREGTVIFGGRKFDSSGIPQGDGFIINDSGPQLRWEEAFMEIAMSSSGDFVVVWDASEAGNHDIYAQRYNSDCVRQGDNFRVNQTVQGPQRWPSCGMDDVGDFVVVWMDSAAGILGQKFDASGLRQGGEFQINDVVNKHELPSVAMNGSGRFVVAWIDHREGPSCVYGQRYSPSGAQGQNFKINDELRGGRVFPAVDINDVGEFVVTWTDGRMDNPDVYAQRYNSSGEAQGSNFCVNVDPPTNDQWDPCIDMNSSGSFVTVWEDVRSGTADIYAQRHGPAGALQGSNFRVNHDREESQFSPSVGISDGGEFIITWVDFRWGDSHIVGQGYDANGALLDVNFKVNDDDGRSIKDNPCVGTDDSCSFVIAWEDRREGHYDIYGQKYDSEGVPQDVNVRVNDDVGATTQWSPSLAMNGGGDFIVVWEDRRGGDFDIYGQRYDVAGVPQAGNFKINTDTLSAEQYVPSASMDASGNCVIVWVDHRNGMPDIYGQRYDSLGQKSGINFKINNSVGHDIWYPSVSMDWNGRFVVVWTDFEDAEDVQVVARRYFSDGIPAGDNVVINDSEFAERRTGRQSIAVSVNTVGFAWMDERREIGWDVFGKLTDWDLTEGVEESNCQLAISNGQLSTYPNPFTHNTVVEFGVHLPALPDGREQAGSSEFVDEKLPTLNIYDLSGRLIRTFDLTNHQSPFNQITWDGRDNSGKRVGAGVFFVKLNAGDKKLTEKVIVVR